jgi:hypothetical protein
MSSDLKSETARINGAKSHGPVTPEGKARSSANSRQHGLTASALIAGESDEHFQLLLADFIAQFQPQTAVETDLVEVMAIARWRLRRLLSIETHMYEQDMIRNRKRIDYNIKGLDFEGRLAFVFREMTEGNSLTLLMRYEGSINRSYDKALKQLLQLQSTRPNLPPKGPLGSFGPETLLAELPIPVPFSAVPSAIEWGRFPTCPSLDPGSMPVGNRQGGILCALGMERSPCVH